jgi:hypothetical protein
MDFAEPSIFMNISTWGSIYMVVKACNYITGNAPVQLLCPKTRWSRGHYGILIFTLISVLDQLQADTCPSMGAVSLHESSDDL